MWKQTVLQCYKVLIHIDAYFVYTDINILCIYSKEYQAVLDTKSQNIPEVVIVRRGAGGVLGIWEGWVNWVKGSKWGQFTSNLRGRWTIPITTGGCQVSGRKHKGEARGS
jgi:hypothetical protein